MSEKNTQVVFEVPHEVIDAQVNAAVMKALHETGASKRLVAAIVDHAMKEEDRNARYHEKDKTVFGRAIREMIRKVAVEEFKAWLEEQRGEIRQHIRAALGRRKKEQVAKMADRLLDALSGAEVHINLKERE